MAGRPLASSLASSERCCAPLASFADGHGRTMLIDSHREFPTSFRTALTPTPTTTPATLSLSVRCHCGAIRFTTIVNSQLEHCHCARCRRSSCSSFIASLAVAEPPQELGRSSRYADTCSAHGEVERLFCGRCRSSLGSTVSSGGAFRLSLGCVVDESIPSAVAARWQADFSEVSVDERALWWTARPAGRGAAASEVRTLTGGCSCGGCAFTCRSGREFQTQHCYCKLCRSLSGSVAQTWVPVRPEGFVWTRRETLQLVRTTGHGQRHMCSRCGCTLSIVYDSQPDCIWPVAGALEDASLPADEEALGAALCRSIHICCSMMQPWYRLPDDKLPRLKYAG